MRELLFRGFHPCEDGKETIWIDGKEIKGYWVLADSIVRQNNNDKIFLWGRKIEDVSDETKVMADCLVEVIPETMGQYISLTDKIEKKIFERDLVKAVLLSGAYAAFEFPVGVVSFKDGAFGVVDKHEKFTPFYAYNSNISIEVIGSIYENPELMEVSDEC